MHLDLSPSTESLISNLIAAGVYKSPEEVVESAVQLVELKRKVDEGLLDIKEGRVAPLDMKTIKQQIVQRSPENANGG